MTEPHHAAPHPFSEQVQQWADQWQQQRVPTWDRDSTFASRPGLAWWQRPWLPLSAFASAFTALLLVFSQTQISITETGFQVSFGAGLTPAELDQRLADFAVQQQLELVNYGATLRSDMREDIAQANQQLVNYVIATNRDERQQDMADLIRYVNAQRADDQVYLANRLEQFSEDWWQQIQPSNSASQR